MHRSTWKAGERRVAKLLGSKRNALSGRNSGVTASDTRHEHLFVECKHSKAHAVWTLYDKTKELAQAEKKTPVIALSRLRSAGVIFCIHQSDLETFIKEWIALHPDLSIWNLARCHPDHQDHPNNHQPSQALSASLPEKPRKRKRKTKPV